VLCLPFRKKGIKKRGKERCSTSAPLLSLGYPYSLKCKLYVAGPFVCSTHCCIPSKALKKYFPSESIYYCCLEEVKQTALRDYFFSDYFPICPTASVHLFKEHECLSGTV